VNGRSFGAGRVLAEAPFAPGLRHLQVANGTQSDMHRAVADGPFRSLRSLNVWTNGSLRESWWPLYASPNLVNLRSLSLSGRAPDVYYATSPLARRVRKLSLSIHDDYSGGEPQSAATWATFFRRVRPPDSLTIWYGSETTGVLDQMRLSGWLRNVYELTINSDEISEYGGAYAAGVGRLFRPDSLPRLARLTLTGMDSLDALTAWDGPGRLEELLLFGSGSVRLGVRAGTLAAAPNVVLDRRSSVAVASDADLDVVAGRLATVRELYLTEGGPNLPESAPATSMTPAGVARFLTSPRAAHLLALDVHLHQDSPGGPWARLLADPAVMPALRRLWINAPLTPAEQEGLNRRFGAAFAEPNH